MTKSPCKIHMEKVVMLFIYVGILNTLTEPPPLTANYKKICDYRCILRFCWYAVVWWESAAKLFFRWLHCNCDCNIVFYWSRGPRRNMMTQSEGVAHLKKQWLHPYDRQISPVSCQIRCQNEEKSPVYPCFNHFSRNSRSIPDLPVSEMILQAFLKVQEAPRTMTCRATIWCLMFFTRK